MGEEGFYMYMRSTEINGVFDYEIPSEPFLTIWLFFTDSFIFTRYIHFYDIQTQFWISIVKN